MNDTRPPLPRDLFDMPGDQLWVMHCAEGPILRVAAEAIQNLLPRELRPWEMRWNEEFVGIPEQVRREGARLFGADRHDISCVPSTNGALFMLAAAIDWREGDEVLAPLGEFPSNAWPWIALRSRGVTFREVPLWEGHRAGADAWLSRPPDSAVEPEQRLIDAIGPRTRLLTASWVRFQDGLRLDLGRLGAGCRARSIPLVVDGIQGAGFWTPDLRDCSAFAAGGHKGLLAPQGAGLLWTENRFRAELRPLGGWLSVEDATNFARANTDFARDFRGDGQRFELGVPNLVGQAALGASLQLINAVGVERIGAHVDRLQQGLLQRLRGTPWAEEALRLERLRAARRLGPIVALHHAGRGPEGLARILRDARKHSIFASIREGYLRIALHGWHDEIDLDRLKNWLRS